MRWRRHPGLSIATYTGNKPVTLRNSTRLRGTTDLNYSQGYDWASNEDVMQVDTYPSGGTFSVHFRTAATGVSLPARSFPRGQEIGLTGDTLTHVFLNRQWLLFTGFTSHTVIALTGAHRSYQTMMDCPPVINQQDTIPIRAAWMLDSNYWLELTQNKQDHGALMMHRLDGGVERCFPFAHLGASCCLVGVTNRNTALMEMNLAPARQPAQFHVFELDLQTGVLRENAELGRLEELKHSDGCSLVLSPHGDRLAWVTRTGQFPIGSVYRVLRGKPQITKFTLYSAHLDGTQLKAVDNVETAYPGELSQTHWMPDAKRLSFVFNGAIYTVPVD